ncbi:MAG: hypothetical protein HFJ38_01000 [Bacilli bacterium]|nr:hypothetical protein [Bacilli bacterium]
MEKNSYDSSILEFVRSLLSKYQVDSAQRFILKYLEKYPNDKEGLHLLILSYIINQNYDKALFLLEGQSELYSQDLLVDLLSLYIKLDMKDKIYEMYSSAILGTVHFSNCIFYKQMEVYLRSKFDSCFSVSRKDIYSLRMINKYCKNAVIGKIKKNHSQFGAKSVFADLDISSLFGCTRNFINSHLSFGRLCLPVYDEYYFYLNGCGVCGDYKTDYFRAVTVVNTSNIITMTPVLPNSYIYYHDFNMNQDKVKVKSFNEGFTS